MIPPAGMIIDSSAILAIYFDEPTGPWVSQQLALAGRLVMSTVNLAECLIRFRNKTPTEADNFEAKLLASGIDFVAPDSKHASIAAAARMKYPLNLGDCFAYALAKTENLPPLTLDADFRATDVTVLLPPAP
jgi:ribonuclease VapC